MTVSTTGSAGLAPDPTRFILIGTSHPGNVGATARAMKVMGFSDLVLVRPRFADVLIQEETVALASGAADILVRARVVDTLAEALKGVIYAIGTAMTPRDFGPWRRWPGRSRCSAWASCSAVNATVWPMKTCTAVTPSSAFPPTLTMAR